MNARSLFSLSFVALAACSSRGSSQPSGDAGASDASFGADVVNDATQPPVNDAATAACTAKAPVCDGTGASSPLCACTPEAPCSCTPSGVGCARYCPDGGPFTSSIDLPACKTSATCGGSHPAYDDGGPVTWDDAGQMRAYCLYRPPAASAASQRPLVVFLHGAGGSADDVYDYTSLRTKAADFDLTGDAARAGFFLAADQGRNLAFPHGIGVGAHHDIYFRDFAAPSKNPDVRAIDHLIDAVAGGGAVDPARIYVVGWSNGSFFGAAYAIARFSTATPGGFHVAGAAMFAGGDPFDDELAGEDAGCSLRPYPRAQPAMYVIHRACDAAVACDASQQARFGLAPGYDVSDWATALASTVGATVQHVIVSGTGAEVAQCDDDPAKCTLGVGTVNHISWPDGLAKEDAVLKNDWEGDAVGATPGMLGFLRAHPHP